MKAYALKNIFPVDGVKVPKGSTCELSEDQFDDLTIVDAVRKATRHDKDAPHIDVTEAKKEADKRAKIVNDKARAKPKKSLLGAIIG